MPPSIQAPAHTQVTSKIITMIRNITTATMTLAIMLTMIANMEMPAMAQAQTKSTAVAPSLPNGATSLNETYQDWLVLCQAGENGRVCLMTQQQRKSDTNQLVLAAEFVSVTADAIRGSLVLPFGLRLADGVTMQIDDGAVSPPLPFSTCLPAGCIMEIAFDAATINALRAGTTAKLVATAHDGGQKIQLALSLKGLAAAADRIMALSAR